MGSGAGGGPHAITVPGFSSRSQTQVFTQFPQRDGADMHDNDIHQPGFSNSEPVEDAPQDVHPDVEPLEEPEPGFSNSKAVKAADAPVEEAQPTDEEPAPAKKTTAKKAAAKKKG